jgi:hypothetical protein
MLLQSGLERKALRPLSRACVDLGDGLLDELISEVARSCSPQPLNAAQAALLEGLRPDEQAEAAPGLRALAAVEAELTERCTARMLAVLANGHGLATKAKAATSEVVTCSNCASQVAAPRYAKHLQDCMLGRGRAASRAANQSMREQAREG